MKKILSIAAVLSCLYSMNSNAAFTGSVNATYDLGAGSTSFSVSETTNQQFFGFKTGANPAFTVLSLISGSNTNLSFELYQDLDALLDNQFSVTPNGSLISTFISGGNPTRNLNLLPNTVYMLRIFADSAQDGAAQVVAAVPVPAAGLLFGSALAGAGLLRRRQKQTFAI